MSDEELIARLRDGCNLQQRDGERAVAHIAALTAKIEELRAERDRRAEMHECAMSERDDATLYADEQKARAEAAEAEAAALTAQLAEKEEQLVSVLRREAATHERHDAKVARLEALNPNRPNELTDPIAVHANMLRGTIAKPTVEQIIHLYGVDALCKALVPVIVQEADVNKTPKCERDLSNVLTESAGPYLLPCPFCGKHDVSTYFDHEQNSKWGFAGCDGCAARGSEVRTGYDRNYNAPWRAEAIAAWNRRALPAAQPDPREAALRDIARQKKTDEMDTEYDVEYADFEGGYNAIIDVARVALRAVQPSPMEARMSDNDFIRRGDAARAVALCSAESDSPNAHFVCRQAVKAISAIPAADARTEALLKRAAQMAYEVWDDPEALANAILALIPEKQP